MLQCVMTIGIQASGKSTWAKKWVAEKPGERKRVNRDDLRMMLDVGAFSPENETFIQKTRDAIILQSLRAGKSVVIDEMNMRADSFKKTCDLVEKAGLSAIVMEKPFDVSLNDAVERDAARGKQGGHCVGEHIIRNVWEKHIGKYGKVREARQQVVSPANGIAAETIEWIAGLPTAIICDLDGTFALMGDRSPYDASRCDIVDRPNTSVVECVKAMHRYGVEIIFMSGREAKDRAATERFIAQHALFLDLPSDTCNWPIEAPAPSVIPHHLFMRATADQRKDSIIKRELFDAHVRGKYNVLFCLDDRNQVVDNWRQMGLTCFQVQEGNF